MQDRLTAEWEDAKLVRFDRETASRSVAHASNFSVEWLAGAAGQSFAFASDDETILLFPHAGAVLDGPARHDVPLRSVVIAPPGTYSVTLAGDGAFAILATHRADLEGTPDRNPKTAALDRTPSASLPEVRIYGFGEIEAPADNRRLKFLRSATMSINIIEYDGPRDRTMLSPHSHADFEQATLTVSGAFTHHLRAEWGKDANLWRGDLHLEVRDAAVVMIPPQVIHTSEGVGDGAHLLFDVFAPPRADFIAKGWVHNAADYAAEALSDA
jgi:mannose-6-phosphate isomerase-like protein (cupin superfamily)